MLTLRVTDQLLQTVPTCLFWDQQAWVFSFSRQDTPRPLNQHDLLHRRRRSFQCLQKKGDAFTSVARHSPKTLELRDSFELICCFFSNLLLRTKNNVSSPHVPRLIYCCWWIGWTRSGKFHRSVTHPAAAITVLLWLQAFFFNVEVKLEVMMDEKETDIMKEKKKMEHDITAGNSLLLRRKKSSKNHDFRENAACDWWLCSGSKTLLIFCICELKFKKRDSDFSQHFVQDTRSGWRHLVAGFYLSTWLPSSSSCMRYDLIYDDLFDCKADFLLQISLKNNTYMPTLCI